MFHAVPVIYKGSGFYTTDYGRPKRPVENGNKDSADSKESTDKDSKASTAEKSSGSADTKSESKEKASAKATPSTS